MEYIREGGDFRMRCSYTKQRKKDTPTGTTRALRKN